MAIRVNRGDARLTGPWYQLCSWIAVWDSTWVFRSKFYIGSLGPGLSEHGGRVPALLGAVRRGHNVADNRWEGKYTELHAIKLAQRRIRLAGKYIVADTGSRSAAVQQDPKPKAIQESQSSEANFHVWKSPAKQHREQRWEKFQDFQMNLAGVVSDYWFCIRICNIIWICYKI